MIITSSSLLSSATAVNAAGWLVDVPCLLRTGESGSRVSGVSACAGAWTALCVARTGACPAFSTAGAGAATASAALCAA
eukprot:CAMPEP_0183300396 /NCGR_PEP_ID=MMETSP0160_2-20130417/6843_1 /TAXON_ID=2839 ORGANISM="Odontella Sinensis, Strain Grunow 1884" /NCGR_SAMPLE_ID=MMETSP0160_2 /ASSEMBLY_ACC=CAM_ASM_000250 /LENGTH=78 /DNA_ID=CAMNT_0025462805 /DNA_START=1395 /DNA_END=1627 /DNA_ORIENTATION=-